MIEAPSTQALCPDHVAKVRAQAKHARENGEALRRAQIKINFKHWCSHREAEAKENNTLAEWYSLSNNDKFAMYKEHYKGEDGALGHRRTMDRNEALGI